MSGCIATKYFGKGLLNQKVHNRNQCFEGITKKLHEKKCMYKKRKYAF